MITCQGGNCNGRDHSIIVWLEALKIMCISVRVHAPGNE